MRQAASTVLDTTKLSCVAGRNDATSQALVTHTPDNHSSWVQHRRTSSIGDEDDASRGVQINVNRVDNLHIGFHRTDVPEGRLLDPEGWPADGAGCIL